jgi:hypothetical protein
MLQFFDIRTKRPGANFVPHCVTMMLPMVTA